MDASHLTVYELLVYLFQSEKLNLFYAKIKLFLFRKTKKWALSGDGTRYNFQLDAHLSCL